MATRDSAPASRSVNIAISEETRRGLYANKAIIAHSRDEFLLDFVADFPPGAQIVARIVTAPAHAKALLETLRENVERYEKQHGKILRRPPSPPSHADA